MKVLILSHNCISRTQNMGKTLKSLFGAFDSSELVQLYLYPSIPKLDFCKSYYRITDNDVIHSVFRRNKCGGVIEPLLSDESTNIFESDKTQEQYAKASRGGEYMRFARDILWKIGNPKSKALKEWLLLEKPDVVFYALGDAVFSLSLARWVSSFLEIPLITYICDDFYFSGKEKSGLQRLLYNRIIRNIKRTIRASSQIVAICDELGEAYKNEFDTPYHTIMTGSSFESGSIKHKEGSFQISYIGNFGLNRWKSLLEIADALNKINAEREQKYELVYYGRENDNLKNKVRYGGYLDSIGVQRVMATSYMLVHTETFDKEYRARLKYSLSTKIADSLASGTGLLVYGSEELASVNYLKTNACAYCITERGSLEEQLRFLLSDPHIIKEYAIKGIQIAFENHNSNNNSKVLHSILLDFISQSKLIK